MKATLVYGAWFILILSACEGAKALSGTVVDAKTGDPIAGAEIVLKYPNPAIVKTDTLGEFVLNSGFTSVMFGGPKFVFDVEKTGYKKKTIKQRNGSVVVKLQTNSNGKY